MRLPISRLLIYSKFSRICYRFRDIDALKLENARFSLPTLV